MEAAEALAVVVRAFRRRKGFTQENLITIDRSYWGRIERGEVNITIDVLIRLAALLEVEPASLILMATCLTQLNEKVKQHSRIETAGERDMPSLGVAPGDRKSVV